MTRSAGLWASICTFATLFALSIAAQQDQPYQETVEVRLINLDVYVEDDDGRRVTGLSADDFLVLEDGEPKEISNFAEYRSGRFVEAAGGSATTTTAETPGVPEQLPRQPRTVIFFVDSFYQTAQDRRRVFEQIRDFSRESLGPGDRAALFNWRLSLNTVVPLTTDLQHIDDALSRLVSPEVVEDSSSSLDGLKEQVEASEDFRQDIEDCGGMAACPELGEDDPDAHKWPIRNCAEENFRAMRRKSLALEKLIAQLRGVEGRKIMVYVAGRFPADTGMLCQSILRTPVTGPAVFNIGSGTYNTDPLVERVTDAANAAGVVLYPIRPDTIDRRKTAVEDRYEPIIGPSPEMGKTLVMANDADALATLADRTGGRLALGNHMIDDVLPEITADLNHYYSLGYRAATDGADRERRITVRMKDSSLRTRAREAVIEKSRLTEVKDQLIGNLVGQPRAGEIDLEILLGEASTDDRGSILPVEVRIPLDQLTYTGTPPESRIRLLSAAGTGLDAVTEISEMTKLIEKPSAELPSSYMTWEADIVLTEEGSRIAFAVLDETTGVAGFSTIDRTAETLAREEQEAIESLNEWERELVRSQGDGKPLLVYFRPEPCYKRSGFNRIRICNEFEEDVLAHPEIDNRLEKLTMIRWEPNGELTDWPEGRPGLALMRADGVSIMQWQELPEGAHLARVLDTLEPHLAEIVRVSELSRIDADEADLATAMLQIRFGFRREAEEILERLAPESSTVGQLSVVRLAFLKAIDGRGRNIEKLQAVIPTLNDPAAAGEAWLAIASLSEGDTKTGALEKALEVSPEGSSQKLIARRELNQIGVEPANLAVIRIPPIPIASERTEVRTIVQSADVASVEFFLDGRPLTTDRTVPFRVVLDLERLPTRHELRAVARHHDGSVLGEDSRTLNGRNDSFWVRFISPKGEVASGKTQVEVVLQSPPKEEIEAVEVDYDGISHRLAGPPYRTTIEVRDDDLALLQARVRLRSGATAEDTKILNSPGLVEAAGVHLIEIPLIPTTEESPRLADIRLVESGEPRELEALIGAEEAPLTLGLVIDTSGSMRHRMLDVQSAAAAFVEKVLRPDDHGFLVSFDSRARLEVPVTDDRARLTQSVRSLSPSGKTALFDAMMLGLLQYETLGGRRAMVVFSDGEDSASRYKLEDVAEVAKRAGVPIYLVSAWSEERRERMAAMLIYGQQQARLERLSHETAGAFFELDSLGAINEVFGEVAQMISRQMLLTYLTETSRDEEWRAVEVKIEGDTEVRAPQGYYSRPR